MTKIRGSTVLITGGASGLGKSLARFFLEAGAFRLLIWDVCSKSLKHTIFNLRQKYPSVSGYVLDVSDPVQVRNEAGKVIEKYQGVNILVNNAAIHYNGCFAHQTPDEISSTLDTNITGPMLCTRYLIPSMLSAGQGHIVNISSASAIVPLPGMAVYAASKSALSTWGECLRLELKACCPGIQVTNVFSGHLNTKMFAGYKTCTFIPTLEPQEVARRIIAAVEKNQASISMPLLVRLAPVLKSILPGPVFDFGLALMNLDKQFFSNKSRSKKSRKT